MNDDEEGGFIDYFKGEAESRSSILKFTFPKKSKFLVLTTLSGSGANADHKKKIAYSYQALDPKFCIYVKSPLVTRYVFTAALFNKFDLRNIPDSSAILDKTVAMSGSKQTKKNDKTIDQFRRLKETGLHQITADLSSLQIGR